MAAISFVQEANNLSKHHNFSWKSANTLLLLAHQEMEETERTDVSSGQKADHLCVLVHGSV